jgi:hypothetical protein
VNDWNKNFNFIWPRKARAFLKKIKFFYLTSGNSGILLKRILSVFVNKSKYLFFKIPLHFFFNEIQKGVRIYPRFLSTTYRIVPCRNRPSNFLKIRLMNDFMHETIKFYDTVRFALSEKLELKTLNYLIKYGVFRCFCAIF